MAKTSTAPAFDPAKHYEVQLTAVVEWKGTKLSPGKRTILRGDAAEALKESIASYREV